MCSFVIDVYGGALLLIYNDTAPGSFAVAIGTTKALLLLLLLSTDNTDADARTTAYYTGCHCC